MWRKNLQPWDIPKKTKALTEEAKIIGAFGDWV